METKKINKEKANKIYNLLVSIGGADESERDDFIYHHCTSEYECTEWRFCGNLGFGGKYRSVWNGVSYYPEDETLKHIEIRDKLNFELKNI